MSLSLTTTNARTMVRLLLGMVAIIVAGALFCLCGQTSRAADQKTAASQTAAPPPLPAAILVPEIAAEATKVSNLLRNLAASLTPSESIERIQNLLPEVTEKIDSKTWELARLLEEQPTLETLQAQQQGWQQMAYQTSEWLKVLTEKAVALRTARDQLSGLRQRWVNTLNAARKSKAPGPVLQQAQDVITAVDGAQAPTETQRAFVLDLQSRVSRDVDRCSTALAQIEDTQRKAVEGILTRDNPPLWSPQLWSRAQARLPDATHEIATTNQKQVLRYVRDFSREIFLQCVFLVLLLVLFCSMGSVVRKWEKRGSEPGSSAITGLEHPYAAAFFCFLFAVSGPSSGAPPTVKALLGILAVAPMISLTKSTIDPRLVPGLFALWVLFAIDAARQSFAGAPLIGQVILVFETVLGMAAMIGWFFLERPKDEVPGGTVSARTGAARVIAGLAFLILAIACAASVTGYLRLSRILTSEVVAGGIWALALYALVRVVGGIVAFGFRVWPLRLLHMVSRHRDLLERRIRTLLVWLAVIVWVGRLLDYIGLLQPTLVLGRSIINTRLERGSISISVGDIIAFVLTVWLSYLFSGFLRFVLREDVYSRIGIQRGASYAVSSLLNYIIIALGFVVALGVVGVDLTKVTVLAGALGVGIGFGLQSVVNNFVSGLILLFERPIHVGDTVEIGDLLGEIRRIGMRASVVRTWQGADIIVPNADLISKQVTNWTLGDSLRRIDLDVGVNYSAEPKDVIGVLESVALKHPDILQNPRPIALFVGYGDSSINFQLRAWTDKFDQWPRIRSDLAVALYDAAHAAGMSFPFPQREVRVLHDPFTRPVAPPIADGPAVNGDEREEKE